MAYFSQSLLREQSSYLFVSIIDVNSAVCSHPHSDELTDLPLVYQLFKQRLGFLVPTDVHINGVIGR